MTKLKRFVEKMIKFDKLLDKQTPVFLLSILVLVLRIPNLFEPYWYGDEGIYLTIGQSLNKGAKLYSEIIDHKTPLIYYLARVQTQLNFRLLNIGWMLLTTVAFYYFTKKLLKSVKQTTFATFIFVILTTLPWFEGNVPNGELFVLGFVTWGALVLSKTDYFKKFLNPAHQIKSAAKNIRMNVIYLVTAGFFFGLGIMTKVPAILDLAVFLSIGYFTFTNSFSIADIPNSFKILRSKISQLSLIVIGTAIPAIISVIYFIAIGSGKAYLDFGLLYNFRYAASWKLPFSSELLQFAFTLPGKFLILVALILFLTFLKKYFKPSVQFIMSWFGLALFASLLSNRPYPHYFIQLVPPLALVLTLIARNILVIIKRFAEPKEKQIRTTFINLLSQAFIILLFATVMLLLNFSPYPTGKYYVNWYKLVTSQITKAEYQQTFDYLMYDNYKAAEIIKPTTGERVNLGSYDLEPERLFIWGTNPMLYALTEAQPTGRFTVSFHIKDFDAFDETLKDLIHYQPMFIVVMNNEDHQFSEFKSYLNLNYIPNDIQFDHFTLWKRNHAVYYK